MKRQNVDSRQSCHKSEGSSIFPPKPRPSRWRAMQGAGADFSSNPMILQRRLTNRAYADRHPSDNQQRQGQRCVCMPRSYVPVQFPAVWSEFRSKQQMFDGIIRCGDRTFPVHRAILSAVSPYFRALFVHNTDTDAEVIIADVSAEIFSLVLDYAYTGSCDVNANNVEQLLPLADRMEVLGLVQLCCKFLFDELTPDNCLGIYKFAAYYFCRDLEERGRKYISQNFREIFQGSPEFKEITCQDLEFILRDDDLNAQSEDMVFQAIKTWVEWRSNERSRYLPRLLGCVRYGLMKTQYFKENVLTWKFVQNQECKEILQPVADYLKKRGSKKRSSHRASLCYELTRPRIPHEILFTVGGWHSNSPTDIVETYDIRADKWLTLPKTDGTLRAYHGTCALNNLIYVIGGYDRVEYFNTVCSFDPETGEWRTRACMHLARCYVSVCAYDGKIYALGGNNGSQRMRLNSCERYDPRANQWEPIASMNWPRSDASCAALNGRIYIAGGYDGLRILKSAEVYDIANDQWSYIAPMRVPRTGESLVAFRGCVYAIGGFNGRDRLSLGEKYNPESPKEWQEVPKMLIARSNFATAVLEDSIFVIGGYNGTLPLANVEYFDANENEWREASPMNANRSALSACVLTGLTNGREYTLHRSWNPSATQKSKRNNKLSSPVVG